MRASWLQFALLDRLPATAPIPRLCEFADLSSSSPSTFCCDHRSDGLRQRARSLDPSSVSISERQTLVSPSWCVQTRSCSAPASCESSDSDASGSFKSFFIVYRRARRHECSRTPKVHERRLQSLPSPRMASVYVLVVSFKCDLTFCHRPHAAQSEEATFTDDLVIPFTTLILALNSSLDSQQSVKPSSTLKTPSSPQNV